MLERFAAFVTERRGLTFTFIAMLLGVSATIVLSRGVAVDFTPQALFTTFETQQDIDARFAEQFGSTENVALVIVRADDVTATPAVRFIHALSVELQERDYADRVESIAISSIPRAGAPGELLVDSPIEGESADDAEIEALRAALATTTLFDGVLISDDRDTAVVAVFLADGLEQVDQLQTAVGDIAALLAALPSPDRVSAEVGGVPKIRVYMVERFMRDQAVLIPVAACICMFMLFLTFRWLPAVVLPSVAVGFTGVLVVAGMALFQEPFNIINQVVPTLIIVIGISDSVHLVSRYQEELGIHGHRQRASMRTLVTMASACFLTSFTTAVGFGSLVVSRTGILARFGITAACAVMLAYVMTVLFLPPALTLVKAPRHAAAGEGGRLADVSERVVGWAIRHPWRVMSVSLALTLGLGFVAANVRIDTTLLEGFAESDPVHVQTRMLEAELNGVLPLEVSLSSELAGRFDDPAILNAVTELQVWLRGNDQVLSTRSYGDVLHEAWAAYAGDPSKRDQPFANRAQVAQLASLLEGGRPDPIAPYVTSDRRHLRVNVQLRDDGSVATLALAARLEDEIGRALADIDDLRVELTGDAYSGSLGLDSLIRDMSNSLGLAFVIIFGIMTLLFRSLRIGLISVPANMLPLLCTMAYMSVRGIALNTTTVIIFSVSIGLAVDDTIHMLARFREERKSGLDVEASLIAAARGSGRAIIVTSVMLGAGMLVMLLSSFMPVRLFGELICVTLVACVVGDLLLLPAMLKVFAKREPLS